MRLIGVPSLDAGTGAERDPHHVHGDADEQQQCGQLHRHVHVAGGHARRVQQAVRRGEDQQRDDERAETQAASRRGRQVARRHGTREARPDQPRDPPAEQDRAADDANWSRLAGAAGGR